MFAHNWRIPLTLIVIRIYRTQSFALCFNSLTDDGLRPVAWTVTGRQRW